METIPNLPPVEATQDSAAEPMLEVAAEAIPLPPADPYNGIDPERIRVLTERACKRLADCRNEMGLDNPGGNGSGVLSPIAREGTWAWHRQCARMEYQGNYSMRRALGGVFLENNWSMNLPARFVDQRAAKHQDDIVGTDPFMATMPDRIDDPSKVSLSKQVESKIQKEIARSNVQEVLSESIRVALTEGERAIKFGWVRDETTYLGPATVAVGPDGEPLRTPKGRFIYRKDDTLDVVIDEQGNFVRSFDPNKEQFDQDGNPALAPGETLQTRLQAEPSFIMPPRLNFVELPSLEQTLVHKDGLEADGLYTEDFIYPITVPRLELADIMAHVYDKPLEALQAQYDNAGYTEALNQKLSESGPRSMAGQPNTETGEQVRATLNRKLICVHETYFRCRVTDDAAKESWLFMVIDYASQLCIYADYLANMNLKRPPFILLRGLQSVPCRAYGMGVYQRWHDKNLAYDMWFNRLALKSSKEGSITFKHEGAISEVEEGHELIFGSKHVYTVKSGGAQEWGANNPPAFRVNLNEVDDFAKELMEMIAQSGELEFGIVSAADGSAEDLNASGTATGIKNIERTGNLLQRTTEDMMVDDIEDGLEIVVDLILENMDEEEVQWIPGENALATLNKEDIRNNLPKDIRLLLTKSRSSESIETNQQIKQTILEYYQLPKVLQKKVRSVYVEILKNLDVQDADEKLHEPTDDEIAQEAQAQQQGDGKQKESISINYKDSPEDIKRQMEAEAGFQPSQIPAASPAPPRTAAPQLKVA